MGFVALKFVICPVREVLPYSILLQNNLSRRFCDKKSSSRHKCLEKIRSGNYLRTSSGKQLKGFPETTFSTWICAQRFLRLGILCIVLHPSIVSLREEFQNSIYLCLFQSYFVACSMPEIFFLRQEFQHSFFEYCANIGWNANRVVINISALLS